MRENQNVSILINNFNYAAFLRRAIDSALAQTVAAEVIVVDDGSTDDSAAIIASYGDRITAILKTNGGQASCFNSGFAASSGDIVCFLDADDFFTPEKVATLLDVYRRNPQIGWCHHSLTRETSDGRNVGNETLPSDGPVDVRRRARLGVMRTSLPATSALSFRRSVLEQLLPMPCAPGIAVGDHYLKMGGALLAPGYMLTAHLAVQTIHSQNLYTGKDNFALKGEILLRTAAALRDRIPDAAAFTDNLAGTAVALSPDKLQPQLDAYLHGVSALSRVRVGFWRRTKTRSARRIGRSALGA